MRIAADAKTGHVVATVPVLDGPYARQEGVERQIRGVCRHQDRAGKGWAVSAADEEDVKWIKTMDADGVRTSHYPQSRRFYDLCDRYGLIVWTELPNVDGLTFSPAFRQNLLACARAMVEQLGNHPSICLWGLFNELYNSLFCRCLRCVVRFAVWALCAQILFGAESGDLVREKSLNGEWMFSVAGRAPCSVLRTYDVDDLLLGGGPVSDQAASSGNYLRFSGDVPWLHLSNATGIKGRHASLVIFDLPEIPYATAPFVGNKLDLDATCSLGVNPACVWSGAHGSLGYSLPFRWTVLIKV